MLSFHSWSSTAGIIWRSPLEFENNGFAARCSDRLRGQDETDVLDIVPASSPDDGDAPIDASPVQIVKKVAR